MYWVLVALQTFSSCHDRSCSPVAVGGLLVEMASLVAKHRLKGVSAVLWLLGSRAQAQ